MSSRRHDGNSVDEPPAGATGALRHSPLDSVHRQAGAKMVPFGGWEMPLAYKAGTVAEHRECRAKAVVFDVSHLGTVRLSGDGAFETLQHRLSNDLRRVAPGRAQYTHLLTDKGGVADDLIVWWRGAQDFDVMPNASNTDGVLAALGGTDVTAERAVLAVQGPAARERLDKVAPAAAAVGRFEVRPFVWQGTSCVVAGTGYTGEDGVEMAVPAAMAAALWEAVVDAGVEPAGLGARDTLRLEAGLPLYGHELSEDVTPLEAGLGWVVGWDKEDFVGKEALERQRAAGPARRLRGLVTEGRRPPRAPCGVVANGAVVGTVTSGNFSPMLERGIALAFVDRSADLAAGAKVTVEVRDHQLAARLVPPPFWPPRGAQ